MKSTNIDKNGILKSITNRTRVIALITLVAEALFVVAAYAIKEEDRLYAFYGCVAVLAIALIGCIWLEHSSSAVPAPPVSALQNSPYLALGERAYKIMGTWIGDALQVEGPDGKPLPGKVEAIFSVENPTTVIGQITFWGNLDGQEFCLHFRMTGGFLYSQFLRCEYNPADTGTVQFGSILLQLSSESDRLTGRFQGYGAASERIVHGTLQLRKKVA